VCHGFVTHPLFLFSCIFLIERQFVKTLQLVTKHLDVSEALLGVYITICHV
jgi:hypothetical protein